MATYIATCPGCNGKFKVSLDTIPRFCVLCGYDTAEDDAAEKARLDHMFDTQQPPHYAHKTVAAVVDKTYRDMETASEARAAAAAEMAGCDVSEMSALKMTNMKDNLRTGDDAHVITAEAKRAAADLGMGVAGAPVGNTRQPEVINFARAGANSGPYARAGMGMMQKLQATTFGRTPEHFPGK